MALIFTDFPTGSGSLPCALLENLWISEPSLGILKKMQHSLVLPNIKYNCVVLFLSQLYWLFIYASKYIFP